MCVLLLRGTGEIGRECVALDWPKNVRPADTQLDCAAIIHTFATRPRPWREALEETMAPTLAEGTRP